MNHNSFENHDLYVKSQHLRSIALNGDAIIWNSLFSKASMVSVQVLEFLDLFSTPRTLSSIYEEYLVDESVQACIEESISSYYLVPASLNERKLLASKRAEYQSCSKDGAYLQSLELIMSEECNFRCTYCIHFGNLDSSDRLTQAVKTMTFETATEAIDNFLATLKEKGRTSTEINFGGGEPLLAWPTILRVLEYCRKNYSDDFNLRFSVNTNASLVTEEIAEQLEEYNVEVTSSLDGGREANDTVRIHKNGKGTYDIIVKALGYLTNRNLLKGIAVTIDKNNLDLVDTRIIDWAAAIGLEHIRIDIDIIGLVEVPTEAIVAKLMHLRSYAKAKGIEVRGLWTHAAENLTKSTLDEHTGFCGAARGDGVCINPSGDLFACGYSSHKIGTIKTMESFFSHEAYQRLVAKHSPGNIEMCSGCMIEGQCSGGCLITWEFVEKNQTDKFSQMCDFQRRMTTELLLEQLSEACSD